MLIYDQTLLSYLDGSLSDDARAKVAAELLRSPELAARLAALRASDVPYQQAFDTLVAPPVPSTLIATVRTLERAHAAPEVPSHAASANDARFAGARYRARARLCRAGAAGGRIRADHQRAAVWWKVGGFSAGAAVFAVLIACAGARFLTEEPAPTPMPVTGSVAGEGHADVAAVSAASPPEERNAWHGSYEPWVRAFVSYQTLYARATLEPLDDEPAEVIATVRAIRLRDDIPIAVPDLRRAGMAFKRLQRLQFDGRAVVQMAYLPREGPPVGLYVVKDTRLDHGPSAQTIPPMQTVTWRREGQMFALVAPSGSVDLLPIARALANMVVPVLYDGARTLPATDAAESSFSDAHESR
jgi:anti-sigma factor RsiW